MKKSLSILILSTLRKEKEQEFLKYSSCFWCKLYNVRPLTVKISFYALIFLKSLPILLDLVFVRSSLYLCLFYIQSMKSSFSLMVGIIELFCDFYMSSSSNKQYGNSWTDVLAQFLWSLLPKCLKMGLQAQPRYVYWKETWIWSLFRNSFPLSSSSMLTSCSYMFFTW